LEAAAVAAAANLLAFPCANTLAVWRANCLRANAAAAAAAAAAALERGFSDFCG
jgi:hypothetical protein